MSDLQRDYLDLQQGGDTGQDNVDAIQPVNDGEGATSTVFRRPSENLRGRSEVTRRALNDMFYYRDFNHLVFEGATGHSISWPGSTTAASTGIIAQTGDLIIRPMLTPASSTKAQINIGATPGTDEMIYNVAASAYATHGMNAVSIEHRNGGVGTTHQVTITDGPVKRILVEFDGSDSSHDTAATKLLFDAAVAGDADLAGLLTSTDNGAAGNTITAQGETFFEGTADQEAHRLASGSLDTLTTGSPLAEGDAVAIWYRYVVEPGGAGGDPLDPKGGVFGGRWESNPDRGTHTIPAASLFVTSDDPQKIPGAVPICKVVNNELVFFDGTRFVAGASGPIGTAVGIYIDDTNFAGPTTNSNNGGISNPLSPATAQQAFDDIDDRLTQLRSLSYTCTDGTSSEGGDFTGSTALQLAITQLAGTGGTIFLHRGTYSVPSLYGYGVNIRIIGEDVDLVTIQPTVLSNQFPAGGMSFENLSFGTNISNMFIQSGDNVRLRDVKFLNADTTLEIQTDFNVCDNISWDGFGTATFDSSIRITGDDNIVRNATLANTLTITGSRNTLDKVLIRRNVASAVMELSGVRNTLRDFRTDITGGGDYIGNYLVQISGTRNVIDGFTISSSAATLTAATQTVVELAIANTCTIQQMRVQAGDHTALRINPLNAIDNCVFRDCTFSNNSTTADTVFVDGSTTRELEVKFDRCLFDDNKQLGNSVANFAQAGDNSAHRWLFYDCRFEGATFDNTPCGHFRHANFYNCYFIFDSTNIPGQDEGLVDGLWRFEGVLSAALNDESGKCVVQDCTFDFTDREIIDDGFGDPIFDGAYLEITHGDLIRPKLINLNQYGIKQDLEGSIVRLNAHSRLDGISFHWTTTAAIQGGTGPSDTGWIAARDDYVTIENVHLVDVTPSGFGFTVNHVRADKTTLHHFTVRNCTFAETVNTMGEGIHSPAATGSGYQHWKWDNVQFGLPGGDGLTLKASFPASTHSQCVNSRFIFNMASHPLGLMRLGDSGSGGSGTIVFANNVVSNGTASAAGDEVFDVTGSRLDYLAFNGNIIRTTDSGSGLRDLFTGAPAGASLMVAAGNTFTNTGGTTQDGSITINTPNVGIP